MIAACLSGDVSIRLAHLAIFKVLLLLRVEFAEFRWCIEVWCTAIFKSYHWLSIEQRSGLWLEHTKAFKRFPLNQCCLSSMLRVIVLLEKWTPVPVSRRLEKVFLKNFPVFSTIHHSFNSDQFSSPCWWHCHCHNSGSLTVTVVIYDVVTTMLHCGDSGVHCGVIIGVGFAPDIAFSLMELHGMFKVYNPTLICTLLY